MQRRGSHAHTKRDTCRRETEEYRRHGLRKKQGQICREETHRMQKGREEERPGKRSYHRAHHRRGLCPDEETRNLRCRSEGLGKRCLLRQSLQGHHRGTLPSVRQEGCSKDLCHFHPACVLSGNQRQGTRRQVCGIHARRILSGCGPFEEHGLRIHGKTRQEHLQDCCIHEGKDRQGFHGPPSSRGRNPEERREHGELALRFLQEGKEERLKGHLGPLRLRSRAEGTGVCHVLSRKHAGRDRIFRFCRKMRHKEGDHRSRQRLSLICCRRTFRRKSGTPLPQSGETEFKACRETFDVRILGCA